MNASAWVVSFGELAQFCARVMGAVFSGRVFHFFGEALRQAGILILGSALVIWGLAFILGLQCGIEGAYFSRSTGAPAYSGVFSAWCDLREIMPYAFGYMMSAKVGTGLVAEIGAMRISDEIDALEVMGINSLIFLCSTRLLAAWMVLPFMYIAAIGAGFLASYIAVVQQIGEVSSGGFFLIFWMFQNPPDLFYSLIKGMAMATVIVLVGCYYGYTASGGPVGVGTATAKSMVLNTVMVHWWDGRHADLLGIEPEGPHWRLARSHSASRRALLARIRTSAPRRTLLAQVRRLEEESAGLFCSAWPRKNLDLLPATPQARGRPAADPRRTGGVARRAGRAGPSRPRGSRGARPCRGGEPAVDRGDAAGPGEPPLGARLERGHRRAGLHPLARPPSLWAARHADALVARGGVLGLPVTGLR